MGHKLTRAAMVAALAIVLAVPFVLRRPGTGPVEDAEQPSDLPARQLIIISPHWEGIREEFERAFSEHTRQKLGHRTEIDWRDHGGTSDCIRYVRSEFKRTPDGIGYDLFFGGGVDPYLQLVKDDLLVACDLPDDVLAAIPCTHSGVEVYDAGQRWFGACLSGFGIIYNKRVMELIGLRQPETWEDLGRPENFTWVGSGDPRSSGSVHMVYEIIAQAYGWERGWAVIVRMGGNMRAFSRSASQVPKDAAVGEVAFGMAIDLYAWKQVAQVGSDRMGFHLPQGVTVVNPDGIAVLKGAPNRELAEEFIAFVLSEPGQKLWALKVGAPGGPTKFELYRMPVIPGFAAKFGDQVAVPLDAYAWQGGFNYDPDKGSARWSILNDMIGATIIDTHKELVEAWRAVKDLPEDDGRVAELLRPVLSEEEMLRMAEENWSDPEFRARVKARWATEAKERYGRIARGK